MHEQSESQSPSRSEAIARQRRADALEIVEDESIRPLYLELRNVFERLTRSNLDAYYTAGELLVTGCRDAAIKRYIPNPEKTLSILAAALGMPERALRTCRRVVEEYSRQEFLAMASAHGVTWSHVVNLMNVSSHARRKELVDRIATEGLTTRELAAEIVPEKRDAAPRGPGRSPTVPKTLRQGLHRASRAVAAFARQLSEAWFGPRFNLVDELQTARRDELPEEAEVEVEAILANLQEIGEVVAELIPEFEATARRLSASAACTVDCPATLRFDGTADGEVGHA